MPFIYVVRKNIYSYPVYFYLFEITQNVRRDIAEGAADPIERRTLKMLKGIVRHYLKFKMEFDEIEHVDKGGIQQREQVEARVFAFAEAANEVL